MKAAKMLCADEAPEKKLTHIFQYLWFYHGNVDDNCILG